jgi:hypothetical protein
MDAEQTIAEIECLERIFAEPDARPLSRSDLAASAVYPTGPAKHSPPPGCSDLEFRLLLLRSTIGRSEV